MSAPHLIASEWRLFGYFAFGPTHKVAALQPAARGQCTRSTKSLRDSEASGLSEFTFASAKDLNDEPR